MLSREEIELLEEAQGELVVESDAGYTVGLDPAMDESLRLEGIARELVNRIQRLRKESGFAVSDRIRLMLDGAPEVRTAADRFADYIRGETLATELTIGPAEALWDAVQDVDLDGLAPHIALAR